MGQFVETRYFGEDNGRPFGMRAEDFQLLVEMKLRQNNGLDVESRWVGEPCCYRHGRYKGTRYCLLFLVVRDKSNPTFVRYVCRDRAGRLHLREWPDPRVDESDSVASSSN